MLLNQQNLASHGVFLIDLRQEQLIARFKGNGVHTRAADNAYWRTDAVIIGPEGKKHLAYKAKGYRDADFTWPKLDPVPSYAVVGPGSKMAVQVQSNLTEAAQLTAMFETNVGASGYTIDSTAGVRAVLVANEETLVLRKGPPDITAKVLKCSISVIDSSGAAAWQIQDQRTRVKPEDFDVSAWVKPRLLPRRIFKRDWEQHLPAMDLPSIR